MGRRQGAMFSEWLHKAREILKESEEFELMRPKLLPRKLFMLIAEMGMWIKYTAHIKQFYPKQFERLIGIARGAGVRPEFVMLMQSFEAELNKSHFRVPGACSAVGVRGTRAKDEEPMIIKNFDYPDNFREMYMTKRDNPEGRNRVLSVSVMPLPGNHDGINEHGLCIAYNYGYGQDKPRINVPLTIVVQEALETCRTTQEAVDFISRSKRCGGALLMICDAQGDLRTLEVSNTKAEERRPQHSVLINTNHYLTEPLAAIDIPVDAVYDKGSPAKLVGRRCRESTEARYARALELLAAHDVIDEDVLLKIFSDHGPDEIPCDNTICRHNDYFITTCSIMFFPVRRKLRVAYGNPCDTPYREFGF